MKKRFTEEQVIGFLKQAEGGVAIKDLCRKHGFGDAAFYTRRRKFGGMEVADAKVQHAYASQRTYCSRRYRPAASISEAGGG